jgi:prolyl oligopeptidase
MASAAPIDSTPFTTDQIVFNSADGTQVPMFLVHREDQKRDGSAPAIVMAYGGFNASMIPQYYPGLYAWLEQGGIFAQVNTRGGGEFGESWHRAGMLANKQHVIDDFVAAAHELIRLGWTSKGKLVAKGESNGGLLVGAAITQQPDLFRVAICRVPLMDMIRYPLAGLGKSWVPEYGSPDDPTLFRALLAYSPYHNVRPGVRYPSTLVFVADSDDRVDPMHARKFVAAMQDASAGGPALLGIERNAGHMGASRVTTEAEEEADGYAFALHEIALGRPSAEHPATATP